MAGEAGSTATALWSAVVASGVYHGLNPSMGWPLAVAAGLMERRTSAFFAALGLLTLGHMLAVFLVLLPFALLTALAGWRFAIQIGAGLLLVAFGVYRLIDRRHPRGLARIPPAQLGLWSFLVAIAHGAGLMLVPFYLGLCQTVPADAGHQAIGQAVTGDARMALAVSVVHAAAMLAAGGSFAWVVYRYVGPGVLSRAYLNLDVVWASSLILVGAVAIAANLVTGM